MPATVAGRINTTTMMIVKLTSTPKPYQTPAIRVLEPRFEQSFLESNTEPIDGGDDSYIPW